MDFTGGEQYVPTARWRQLDDRSWTPDRTPWGGQAVAPVDTSGSTEVASGLWDSINSSVVEDPGSGNVAWNNGHGPTATIMSISRLTNSSSDASAFLSALTTGDNITVQQSNDSSRWVRYTVSGPVTTEASWFQIPVTFVSAATSPPNRNGEVLIRFVFSASGGGGSGGDPEVIIDTDEPVWISDLKLWVDPDANDEIPAGPTGPQGPQGEKGDKGDPGPQGEPGQDAVIPPRLGAVAVAVADWDLALENGWYTSDVNGPVDDLCLGQVVVHSDGWVTQRVWQFTADLNVVVPVYVRRSASGTASWGPWLREDGRTDWTPVTFENGWANYGSPFQTAQYRKVGDVVQLRGLVRNGTAGTVMFTLPEGFRPPAALLLPAIHNTPPSYNTGAASTGTAHTHNQAQPIAVGIRVDVSVDGTVKHYSATTGTGYVDLGNIQFSVTP